MNELTGREAESDNARGAAELEARRPSGEKLARVRLRRVEPEDVERGVFMAEN